MKQNIIYIDTVYQTEFCDGYMYIYIAQPVVIIFLKFFAVVYSLKLIYVWDVKKASFVT